MTAEGNRLFQTCRAWSRALRAAHLTWDQIATVLTLTHPGHTPLQLYRLAHGRSAADITGTYNSLDPAGTACLHVCRLYDWEAWPAKGRRPTPATLITLARIYQTTASNLITQQVLATYRPHDRNLLETTDFRHLDPFYRAPSSPNRPPSASMKASVPARPQPENLTLTPAECTQVFRAVALEEPDMKRRDLLVELALTLGGMPALTLLRDLPPGEDERLARLLRGQGRVDAEAVSMIEHVLTKCRRLDDLYGPAKVLPVVRSQCDVVGRLLRTESLTPNLRGRLAHTYAELAQFSGFLHYDTMNLAEADRAFDDALHAALETGDATLIAYIQTWRSEVRSFVGDRTSALDRSMAAQGWARRSGSNFVKARTDFVEAWALSLNGQSAESLRQLDLGIALLDKPTVTEPSYLYWMTDPRPLEVTMHCIYGALGRPNNMINVARSRSAKEPTSYGREEAFCLIHLGTALTKVKEIPEATATLAEATTIMHRHSSGHLGYLLGRARQRLEPWAGNSYVRDLDDKLLAAGVRWRDAPA